MARHASAQSAAFDNPNGLTESHPNFGLQSVRPIKSALSEALSSGLKASQANCGEEVQERRSHMEKCIWERNRFVYDSYANRLEQLEQTVAQLNILRWQVIQVPFSGLRFRDLWFGGGSHVAAIFFLSAEPHKLFICKLRSEERSEEYQEYQAES